MAQNWAITTGLTYWLFRGFEGLAQTAVLPLVPYVDTLRWVFIAVAFVGIAVTIYARLYDWRRG